MEHQRMISHRLVGVSLDFSPVVPTSNITRDQIVKDLIPQWNSMGSSLMLQPSGMDLNGLERIDFERKMQNEWQNQI